MRHFLEIDQLTETEALALIERAFFFKKTKAYPAYRQSSVANLFYENSTRTRISFELAALQLSIPVVNVDLQHSSEQKGESMADTIRTLSAMGIQMAVIRHKEEYIPHTLAKTCGESMHIINAGDGTHAHPSQALLDMMTIMEKKPALAGLKIAVVGDVRHSRVANSLQCLSALLGIGELVLIAPEPWQPVALSYGRLTSSLQEGLSGADVVMCLRVQRERLLAEEHLDLDDYRKHYALTRKTLSYAKKGAMVMHPGPINRGVEIDSDVADGSQSVILQQVTNGVFMRMAILEAVGLS